MNIQTPEYSSLRDFLTVVFKRKYQIILFFIITVVAIVGITFSKVPIYKVTGKILVKIGSRNAYSLDGSSGVPINSSVLANQLNTEKTFLESRFLAENVINSLGLEIIYPWLKPETYTEEKYKDGEYRWFNKEIFQQPFINNIKGYIFQDSTDNKSYGENRQISGFDQGVSILQKNLLIRNVGRSNILEIDFKHSNPEIAAIVVNTFMDTYLDERLLFQRNVGSSTFFKDQSLAIKDRLDEAEKALEQYKNENNITDLEQQRRLLLQQISNLQVVLNTTSSMVTETESRIALIAEQLSRTPETIPQVVEETDQNQALMSRLESMLVELQIEEKELLSKYTPQSRMVKNVKERIVIVETKIKEQQNRLVQTSSMRQNSTFQRLEEDLFSNQTDLEALSAKKEMLTRQLAGLEKDQENLNRMEPELEELQQSVDLYRGNYKLYLAKLETSRIEDAMDNEKINDVVIMDRATPPLKPIAPNYGRNIILAILLGGMGGILIAIIGDFLDDNLETPEDVERNLQLTVLTSIPDFASRKRLDHRKTDTTQSDVGIQKH